MFSSLPRQSILRPYHRRLIWISPAASRSLSILPASRAKVPPPIGEEPLRACGVADTATEAGPRSPGGVLQPVAGIIAGTSVVVFGLLYLFMPSSPSKTGHAVQSRILDHRKALEVREGDREEEETEKEKNEERKIIQKHRLAASLPKK